MYQLQTIELAGLTQTFDQTQDLRGVQAELGFFTSAGLPFAGTL